MKTPNQEQMLGISMKSSSAFTRLLLPDPAMQRHQSSSAIDAGACQSIKKYNYGNKDSILNRVNKNGRKVDSFVNGFREHVKLGAKISETVKGKLSLGARIVKVGGLRKMYKKLFTVNEGEKLLKASHCYLSTTAGPLAGLLFISTHKIAFCSDRSIKLTSPTPTSTGHDHIRLHYKVTIPLGKIRRVLENENMEKPSQKYMEIVTVDDFEFWFMGFLNYQKTFNLLQELLLSQQTA